MLHFTFRQLSVFEAVARRLSFSRAADELHLTQPAVSMQIKQLEGNVGMALFEQVGKKIYLTEAGNELFHYSRVIAQNLGEVEAVLNELKGLKRGKLKISVASTANYFAPQLLATFSQRFPTITVSLNVTNRGALLQQLGNNEMDMAIMGQPPRGDDLVAESFMDNPLVVIAPVTHPLAQEGAIPVERLGQETFLIREEGSGTRIAMTRYFDEYGIQPHIGMEMSSTEAIKQAVQAGLGLGVVSLHTVELELESNRLKLLDVQHFPIERHWFIVHRRDKRLSAAAQAFKTFMLTEAEALLTKAPPLSKIASS